MEWSEKVALARGPLSTCVVCETGETAWYLSSVTDRPPVHVACAVKVLIAYETIRRGQPLTETHKRWLTRNRLTSGPPPSLPPPS